MPTPTGGLIQQKSGRADAFGVYGSAGGQNIAIGVNDGPDGSFGDSAFNCRFIECTVTVFPVTVFPRNSRDFGDGAFN